MLVLARKQDQALEFPELGVVVRVVGLTGRKVQLGIEAPQRIKIVRSEIAEKTRSETESGKQTRQTSPRRFEPHRLSQELNRLESQIAALAELAGQSNRELAREVASDSEKQLARIEQLLVAVVDSANDTLERDSSRASGIDEPRRERPAKQKPSTAASWSSSTDSRGVCVRQRGEDFVVDKDRQEPEPHDEDGSRVLWFPSAISESQPACA